MPRTRHDHPFIPKWRSIFSRRFPQTLADEVLVQSVVGLSLNRATCNFAQQLISLHTRPSQVAWEGHVFNHSSTYGVFSQESMRQLSSSKGEVYTEWNLDMQELQLGRINLHISCDTTEERTEGIES